MSDAFTPTERTTVRREDRAAYERNLVHAILDEALICHVAFVTGRHPFVVPTIHARVGDTLYLHGSPATRMMRVMKGEVPVTVSATIIDGIVFTRSAFHHSMNYRSAVVVGTTRPVADPSEKRAAFDALVDHVAAGRTGECRPTNDKELRATAVVALPIEEASAKVRGGPPHDEDDDLALDHWAGVLPLALAPSGPPEPAPDLRPGVAVAQSVAQWSPWGAGTSRAGFSSKNP